MPNFVVMGGQDDRREWIEKLKPDFKAGEATFHTYNDLYETQDGYNAQKKALENADAVFLIVSATLNSNEIRNEVERTLQSATRKGLGSDVPLYLVLQGVVSQDDLGDKTSKKFNAVSAKNSKDKTINLYQPQTNKKTTKLRDKTSASSQESSTLYFHDVFGYSQNNKFPANLKNTLSNKELEERRGKINKLQKKTTTYFSSTPSTGKKSSPPQSPSLPSKNQIHGYTIVLKSLADIGTIEELGKDIKPNEFRLALNHDGLLYYSVIDPKNILQTHPIKKEELDIYLPAKKNYQDCVTAFEKSLKANNQILLNPYISAILNMTKKAGHTKDSLNQTHGGSRSDGAKKEHKTTLIKGYAIKVMASTQNIDDNVLPNEFRMAVSGSGDQAVLHYAVLDANGDLQIGEITAENLKAALTPQSRYNNFFAQFKQALSENNSELVRPFLDDILAAISTLKGCQLKENVESSDPEADSENIFKENYKMPHNSPKTTADGIVIINSTTQGEPETSKKSPPKRWSKKWLMASGSLTLTVLAIVGFILEAALPTGFLATGATVGWLTAAIAGTFLAPLTPVGVFMLTIFLTALIIGGIAFCIENREKIRDFFIEKREQIRQALFGSERENIVQDNPTSRNDNNNQLKNIVSSSEEESDEESDQKAEKEKAKKPGNGHVNLEDPSIKKGVHVFKNTTPITEEDMKNAKDSNPLMILDDSDEERQEEPQNNGTGTGLGFSGGKKDG